MGCVMSIFFSILGNGIPNGHITPNKGLRQDDLLSPYIFLLYMEGLISLLSNSTNEITGIKVSREAPRINHLLFVDNSVIFYKANS